MKIIFLCLGTRGDVQPYVAIGKTAIQQGHQVSICTGESFQQLIEDNGITYEKCSLDFMQILQTEEGKAVFEQGMKHPMKAMRYAKETIKPLYRKSMSEFYQACLDKDVIIFHPKVLGAVDIAEKLGVQCISMPPIPMIYPIAEFPNLAITTKNLGPCFNKMTYKLANVGAESGYIRDINDFRKSTLNVKARKAGVYMIQRNGARLPIIYPIASKLFTTTKEFQKEVILSGFPILKENVELDQETKTFLENGKKPIIISFSSMPLKNAELFVRKIVKALEDTGNRAVLLSGNSGMRIESDDRILVKKYLPHDLIFPEGKGILHHGGVGTTAAALRSGAPQVIMPFNVDQPFWAKRLYNLGYALEPLHENDAVDKFVLRFRKMDQKDQIQSAGEMKAALQKEDGNKNAVACIEKLYSQWKK